jgi:hypothetical protein
MPYGMRDVKHGSHRLASTSDAQKPQPHLSGIGVDLGPDGDHQRPGADAPRQKHQREHQSIMTERIFADHAPGARKFKTQRMQANEQREIVAPVARMATKLPPPRPETDSPSTLGTFSPHCSFSSPEQLFEQLDHAFQSHVARFHSTFHSGCKHGRPCLSIRQCHSHRHQRARTVCIKSRFNMVVGRGIW